MHDSLISFQQTYFTSPMGKTAIDEQHPLFGGIYVGDITIPSVKEAVESADLTIYVGALKSDFNTGSFSWHITPENTVELHSDHTIIQVSMLLLFLNFAMLRLLEDFHGSMPNIHTQAFRAYYLNSFR